jgi:hypothetical protein
MDTRAVSATVGRNVAAAVTRTGHTPNSLLKTAGIPAEHIRTRLNGETPFTCAELLNIALTTRTHPADFLAGSA